MLDTALITYLAKLSRIEVDEERKAKLIAEMSAIVDLMDTMNDLVLESDNLNIGESSSLQELRQDIKRSSYDREKLLQNASHQKDGFFVVPKIME